MRRDDSNDVAATGDELRPMLAVDLADHQVARLIFGLGQDFDQAGVVPQCLSTAKVDAVLLLIGCAFVRIEFEGHGMDIMRSVCRIKVFFVKMAVTTGGRECLANLLQNEI